MRVIYIDTLFFINLIVNYLLLMAVYKICALHVKRIRIILAALLGASYAVLAVLPGFLYLQSIFIKLGVGVLMLLCAFGGLSRLLRIGLVFFSVTAAFGGIVMAVALLGGEIWAGGGVYLPISVRALLLSFGLSYGLLTLVFKFMAPGRGKGGYIGIDIKYGDKEVSVTALKDTGNSMRDPVSGMPLPIVELKILSSFFDSTVNSILDNQNNITAAERLELIWQHDPSLRFRLIPYSAVGVRSDMLLAFKPDIVKLNGRTIKGLWIAVSPTKVSSTGAYSALVNCEI